MLLSEKVTFLTKKRCFLWISPKMLQNNRIAEFICMWLTLRRKTSFLNIFSILLVWSKRVLKQIQIFLRIFPFSNMLRKTNFLSISVLFSEIVTFWTKKKSSLWISLKMLQNNRKAYFICMWLTLGRKTVFIYICPLFTGLIKTFFKQIQIFLKIYPFQTC